MQEYAEGQLKRIEDAIYKLDRFPERFRLYKKEPWRSLGVRVLFVDNYIALYVIVDAKEQVTIIRVMFLGRDVETILASYFNDSP